MKKFAITLMLGALMLSALAGCGKKEEVAPKNDNNTVVESENKVDASETVDSVSPTESVKESDVVATDVVTTDIGTAVGEDEKPAERIYNGIDDSVINVETDENGNILNYADIVNPYRDAISERLGEDLTGAKSKFTFASVECIDVDINSISDDDALLFENRNPINISDDSIENAVYSKFYLATLYKILEKYDVPKDVITSFESYGLNNNSQFMCSIDSDAITEVTGYGIGELSDERYYHEFYIEVRLANGNLVDYVTVLPVVFRMK